MKVETEMLFEILCFLSFLLPVIGKEISEIYGVDVSFPIHHGIDPNSFQVEYDFLVYFSFI